MSYTVSSLFLSFLPLPPLPLLTSSPVFPGNPKEDTPGQPRTTPACGVFIYIARAWSAGTEWVIYKKFNTLLGEVVPCHAVTCLIHGTDAVNPSFSSVDIAFIFFLCLFLSLSLFS